MFYTIRSFGLIKSTIFQKDNDFYSTDKEGIESVFFNFSKTVLIK